ncbi:MAG: hypothetical protein AAF542_07910 [Pseudomonadota bacterium]
MNSAERVCASALCDEVRENGYAIIPQAFSMEEIADLRSTLSSYFSNGDYQYMHGGKARPDFLNCEYLSSLSWILRNEKVVAVLNELVGQEILYCHHSDAQMNVTNSWHKDHCSIAESDPWAQSNDDEEYGVYKIALYLQDYSAGDSYALRVRKGSHMSSEIDDGEVVDLCTGLGDAIIFDCRLAHMGYSNVITGNGIAKNIVDYVRSDSRKLEVIENYRHLGGWRAVHKFLNWLEFLALSVLDRKKRNPKRLTVLYAFGRPNAFTIQHIESTVERQNIHNGADSNNDQSYDVVQNLKKAGIRY